MSTHDGAGFHDSEELPGDVAFEAAGDLASSFTFGLASLDVVAGGRVVAASGDGDGVQSAVEGAVAAAVESVSGDAS